nr:mannose/glucose-specific lectin-like [Lolium perenne]
MLKLGPWGIAGGKPGDINRNPQRLVRISICITECINALEFMYDDQDGQTTKVGTWGAYKYGGSGWTTHFYDKLCIYISIDIKPGEHVNHVSGTTNKKGVSSLKIITSYRNEYGPYGKQDGTEFSLPLRQGRCEVVAFFCNYGATLESLGVYVRPRKTGSLVQVGPWGGHGGNSTDLVRANMPNRLQRITIHGGERSGERIYGFSYAYIDKKGKKIEVGPWGSTSKGRKREFTMNGDNYVNFISGTHDEYGITSLMFIDFNEDVHGPYGCAAGHAFSLQLPEDGAAVSFFGRAGTNSLVGFGAYVALQDD